MATTWIFIQKAVLWNNPVSNGRGGYTFDAPVEIDVRWEDSASLFVDAEGKEQVSRSKVFVDRDVAINAYLKIGALTGTENVNPRLEANAYPIKQRAYTPEINGIGEPLREAFL